MCGEKLGITPQGVTIQGSPPRVRGKAICRMRWCKISRITPARAGKRRTGKVHRMPVEDHPRVCGEKAHMVCTHDAFRGSPPRVRGKARQASNSDDPQRITPACAGKRLKKAHKIKDFDPVPIRFHLVFRRFERWCSNLPTPDGNVPV